MWGSAQAYRYLVGHIAASTGVDAFVPDYRLAPEHPFPAAIEDVHATYIGLLEAGFTKVVITGDSAGGNLALELVSFGSAQKDKRGIAPPGVVALSPVTDLTLTGGSWDTRAVADPFFIRSEAEELVRTYLGDNNPANPSASPLYPELTGLPPIRVHVGDAEVLLDDAIRYVEQAVAAGVDVRVDVWEGLAHGFLGSIGHLEASSNVLTAIGQFLTERLADTNR